MRSIFRAKKLENIHGGGGKKFGNNFPRFTLHSFTLFFRLFSLVSISIKFVLSKYTKWWFVWFLVGTYIVIAVGKTSNCRKRKRKSMQNEWIKNPTCKKISANTKKQPKKSESKSCLDNQRERNPKNKVWKQTRDKGKREDCPRLLNIVHTM